ncbi:MAG: hypothetical protein PHI86_03165 [Candidatus Omnitrophica bacterium]|nr:hypothetical protein [Candidatus Omnitrophota bacterium]HOX53986.1 hypothetical protein [Candidatus Omnitrophota bacterium]
MSKNIIGIIKLIFAIIFVPIVVFCSISFFKQIHSVDREIYELFVWGIFSYLILHLFIYEPDIMFKKGQDMVSVVFRFFAPLVNVASFVLPIYTIFLLIAFSIIKLFFKDLNIAKQFIFLVSFTLTLHMVFCAKALKSKTDDVLKANYFFSMQLIYIVNLFIVAFSLSYFLNGFSFIDFYNNTFSEAVNIYNIVFSQLFINKT